MKDTHLLPFMSMGKQLSHGGKEQGQGASQTCLPHHQNHMNDFYLSSVPYFVKQGAEC